MIKKVGRPKSDNPRNITIRVRVNQSEYDILKAYSEKQDVSLTEAIRRGIKKLFEVEDLGNK